MNPLTIISTCSPNEKETYNFINAVSRYAVSAPIFRVSLILVDDVGVFYNYSGKVVDAIYNGKVCCHLFHPSKKGQLWSIMEAIELVDEGVVVTMDPDMESNLKDIGRLYEKLDKEGGLVFSFRQFRSDVSVFRVWLSAAFNFLLRLLFSIKPDDVNTPMVMFEARLKHLFKAFPSDAGHPKLYFPYILGDRFCQVPIRVEGCKKRSSYSWRGLAKLAKDQFLMAAKFAIFVRRRK